MTRAELLTALAERVAIHTHLYNDKPEPERSKLVELTLAWSVMPLVVAAIDARDAVIRELIDWIDNDPLDQKGNDAIVAARKMLEDQ